MAQYSASILDIVGRFYTFVFTNTNKFQPTKATLRHSFYPRIKRLNFREGSMWNPVRKLRTLVSKLNMLKIAKCRFLP